ncbi:phosphoribosylformylglycinamidine synthase I [Candidatus Peregrinibacteria bacterium]|nr:phosphoribosylformylglycinamidine synthase I [Candidatus Peregrinibacteria bacterium]
MKPRALIITGYGINCEEETAKCFNWSGAQTEIIHVNDLIANPNKLKESQILAFPGGFSYGDDTGSGNAMANKIRNNLNDEILKFANDQGKLVIGICNGFQIIVNLGLVPATLENEKAKYGIRQAALMPNSTARYQCRWIWLKKQSQKCIWTKDIDLIHLPVAHGEGNFYAEAETIKSMEKNDQIAFSYVNEDGSPANLSFPANPNGALMDIAGTCDPTGRIFGLMPHPERFNSFTNEEGWELKKEKLIRSKSPLPKEGDGMKIFKNAVDWFK